MLVFVSNVFSRVTEDALNKKLIFFSAGSNNSDHMIHGQFLNIVHHVDAKSIFLFHCESTECPCCNFSLILIIYLHCLF